MQSPISICAYFHDQYRFSVAKTTADDVWHHCKIYHRWFRRFVTQDRQPDLHDITTEYLIACRTDMVRSGQSNAYANKLVRYLRSMRNRAYEAGLCDCFTGRLKMLKEAQHAPTAWTVDEMGELITAAESIDGMFGGVCRRDWWLAIIWLCYNSGLRLDCMLELAWTDFDLPAGRLLVPPKLTKSNKGIVVTLKSETQDVLRSVQIPKSFPEFTSAISTINSPFC